MKLGLIFCAGLGLFSFTGAATVQHTPQNSFVDDQAAISVPGWMKLPQSEYLSSVTYLGDVGAEASRGEITLSVPSDGSADVARLADHFESLGFKIVDHTSEMDRFVGVGALLEAVQSTSGRRITVVSSHTLDGATLRISYADSGVAIANPEM